jgi:predicted AAA+ superfamily ATPase
MNIVYYNRTLEDTLKHYLHIFPVIALTGPRQSGKSTLLLHLLKDDYRYISFDEHRMTSIFYDDPEKFMAIHADKVIFDEVQKVPEIFDYLKISVDRDRERYGKFIISGSS